jgi:hypothetical protein
MKRFSGVMSKTLMLVFDTALSQLSRFKAVIETVSRAWHQEIACRGPSPDG